MRLWLITIHFWYIWNLFFLKKCNKVTPATIDNNINNNNNKNSNNNSFNSTIMQKTCVKKGYELSKQLLLLLEEIPSF